MYHVLRKNWYVLSSMVETLFQKVNTVSEKIHEKWNEKCYQKQTVIHSFTLREWNLGKLNM